MDDLRSFERAMLADVEARQWASEVALKLRLLQADLAKQQQPVDVVIHGNGADALISLTIDLDLWRKPSMAELWDSAVKKPEAAIAAAATLDAALETMGIPATAIFDDAPPRPGPVYEDDGFLTMYPAFHHTKTPEAAPAPSAEEAPEQVEEPVAALLEETPDPVEEPAPAPIVATADPAAPPELLPASAPMSDEAKVELVRLYKKGMSNADIAARMGRAPQGFYHIVNRVVAEANARIRTTSMAPAPTPAPDPDMAALTSTERRIDERLTTLGYRDPWTPQLDLALVADLTKGRKLAEIALDLGIDTLACKTRFQALCPDPTFEAQRQLLVVLTHRAAVAKAA